MKFLLFLSVSFKKEIIVIFSVLVILIVLPVAGLFAITNVSVLAGLAAISGAIAESGPTPTNVSLYEGPGIAGNTYAFGNCTFYVYIRRAQIGEPIPNTWGNAATWATRASADGYTVDHTPLYGAIMQTSTVDNGLGHVAFVENVDPDGTWHISEMNVVGLDEVDDKAMPASTAMDFSFIH
jgi:surface antigen